jgi:hypothetical protein
MRKNKGDKCMRNTMSDEAYEVFPDGRCSCCKTQISIMKSEYSLYKTRIIKIFKNGKAFVKCPQCRNMVLVRLS